MNCIHTDTFCARAASCTLNDPAERAYACGRFSENMRSSRAGCGECINVNTERCRWECFREVVARSESVGYVATVERGDGAKVRAYVARLDYERMTPYQQMRHDGTLAKQRAATAAAKKAVDNEDCVPLQCAASAIAGGE
jgi:hypothetical protein